MGRRRMTPLSLIATFPSNWLSDTRYLEPHLRDPPRSACEGMRTSGTFAVGHLCGEVLADIGGAKPNRNVAGERRLRQDRI